MVLKELPEILDDQLGGARVAVLSEPLVDPEHVDELVGQVVLRSVPTLQRDGGAHGDRRHKERGEDHPLRAGDLRVHPEDAEVLIRDPLEPLPHLLRRELVAILPERRRLVQRDLSLFLAAVGAALALLRLAGGLFRDVADLRHVSAEFLDLLHLRHVFLGLLARQEETAALSARGLQ